MILKKFAKLFALLFLFTAALRTGVYPAVYVNENIKYRAIWSKDYSPYIITGQVTVEKKAKLTIEAGVVVKFAYEEDKSKKNYIIIDGELELKSNPQNKIIFTSVKDDEYGGDTNNDGSATNPERGDWGYIKITNGNSGLHDCIIRFGGSSYDYTSRNYQVWFYKCSPDISGCVIENTYSDRDYPGNAIYYEESPGMPAIYNNTISGAGNGIYYLNAYENPHGPIISNNAISDCGVSGIYCENVSSSGKIENNNIILCGYAVRLESSRPEIHYNNFSGNRQYAVYNESPSEEVDASLNYWGSASGPFKRNEKKDRKSKNGNILTNTNFMPYAVKEITPGGEVVLVSTSPVVAVKKENKLASFMSQVKARVIKKKEEQPAPEKTSKPAMPPVYAEKVQGEQQPRQQVYNDQETQMKETGKSEYARTLEIGEGMHGRSLAAMMEEQRQKHEKEITHEGKLPPDRQPDRNQAAQQAVSGKEDKKKALEEKKKERQKLREEEKKKKAEMALQVAQARQKAKAEQEQRAKMAKMTQMERNRQLQKAAILQEKERKRQELIQKKKQEEEIRAQKIRAAAEIKNKQAQAENEKKAQDGQVLSRSEQKKLEKERLKKEKEAMKLAEKQRKFEEKRARIERKTQKAIEKKEREYAQKQLKYEQKMKAREAKRAEAEGRSQAIAQQAAMKGQDESDIKKAAKEQKLLMKKQAAEDKKRKKAEAKELARIKKEQKKQEDRKKLEIARLQKAGMTETAGLEAEQKNSDKKTAYAMSKKQKEEERKQQKMSAAQKRQADYESRKNNARRKGESRSPMDMSAMAAQNLWLVEAGGFDWTSPQGERTSQVNMTGNRGLRLGVEAIPFQTVIMSMSLGLTHYQNGIFTVDNPSPLVGNGGSNEFSFTGDTFYVAVNIGYIGVIQAKGKLSLYSNIKLSQNGTVASGKISQQQPGYGVELLLFKWFKISAEVLTIEYTPIDDLTGTIYKNKVMALYGGFGIEF